MSRRAALAAGVLLLWMAGLGLLARRELFQPASQRLLEAALRISPGATFYSVSQGSSVIGFASSTVDTITRKGIQVTDYFVADLPMGGRLHRASVKSVVDLTRSLALDRFQLDLDTEAGPMKISGVAEGDTSLLLAIGSGGAPPDTQRLRVDGPVLLPTLVPLVVALGERPKVGKRYTLSIFDPGTMAPKETQVSVAAESLFIVSDSAELDPTARRWKSAHEDTVRAWKLLWEGTTGSGGWVDEQGRLVQSEQPGGLVLRRTAYEQAFTNWRLEAQERPRDAIGDNDIIETTAIAANAPINKKTLTVLTVRLSNVDLAGYDLAGGRQALARDTLVVRREPPSALQAEYVLPGDVRHRVRFRGDLAPEPLLQVGAPAIVGLATGIAGRDRDPRVVAERISQWVHDSLKKEITFGVPDALQVLRSRSGDCNEHTQLFIALARSVGIPARSAAGLALVNGKFYYHAWPEVFLGSWVAVDPTFGQFPADAAHLRFVNGGLARQAELLRLIGNLDIDVIESK